MRGCMRGRDGRVYERVYERVCERVYEKGV